MRKNNKDWKRDIKGGTGIILVRTKCRVSPKCIGSICPSCGYDNSYSYRLGYDKPITERFVMMGLIV